MKTTLVAIGLVLVSSLTIAQEGPPPMLKAGPEHELLKGDVGVWDATVEAMTAPGQPMATSKGVETNTLVGGVWLITDFKSEMMGAPFEGHGVTGWDPAKKKYVGTWVDTMAPGIGHGESTYDAATKTVTGTMEGMDASGAVQKSKSKVVYSDPDTRVFTISAPGPDGKDMTVLKISYKRRK
jgi:hypothetical protein